MTPSECIDSSSRSTPGLPRCRPSRKPLLESVVRFLKPSLFAASSVRWLRSTLRSRTWRSSTKYASRPEQRLDVVLLGGLVELDGAVHDAVVGQADGRLIEGGGALGELADVAGAVEQRVLGVDVQVRDGRGAHRGGNHRRRGGRHPCVRAAVAPAICGVQNAADVALRRPGRAARDQRVRDLHRSRRIGAGRVRVGGRRGGQRDLGGDGRPALRLGRADRVVVRGEAARVVPGASAGIALAVAACIARGDGPLSEQLPRSDAVVLLQRGHEYKYARCAALAGARVQFTDDISGALERGPAAILHPAHLDDAALRSTSSLRWRAAPGCQSSLTRRFRASRCRRFSAGRAPVTSPASRPSTSGARTAGASWPAARVPSRTSRHWTSWATSRAAGGPLGARSSSTGPRSRPPWRRSPSGSGSITMRGSRATRRGRIAGFALRGFAEAVHARRAARGRAGQCRLSCPARLGWPGACGGRPEHPGDRRRRRARAVHRGADGGRARGDRVRLEKTGRWLSD